MHSTWTTSLWQCVALFGGLFVALPIFDALHRRHFNPAHWFLDLIEVLRKRPQHTQPLRTNGLRRILIAVSMILSCSVLSMLPLTSVGLSNAAFLSPMLAFALILLVGMTQSAIGLTFTQSLAPLTAVEQFLSRQTLILVIALGCLATPFSSLQTVEAILLDQLQPWTNNIPALGLLQNPVGFIVSCVALAIYTKQWLDNENATLASLRKPIEARLDPTLLLTFKIARQLEYLTLYALLTTVFAGGSSLLQFPSNPAEGFVIFFGKLFLLVAFVLGIASLVPRMRSEQVFRTALLYLLPTLATGMLLTRWLNLMTRGA